MDIVSHRLTDSGQSGPLGHHVVQNVDLERLQELGRVITQPHSTEEHLAEVNYILVEFYYLLLFFMTV